MSSNAPDPEIAVVVVAGERALRLLWLLNALEDQAGGPARFEAIVVAPPGRRDADVEAHPLVARGTARFVDAPSASPAVARNLGWRAAGAPLVAFVDEDTRPGGDWIDRALAHAAARPGAVVAGALASDPLEGARLHAPLHDTRWADAGEPFAPLAGSVWPRSVLEGLGGLDETAPDEDAATADLLARAAGRGTEVAAAPDLVLYDSVRILRPRAAMRSLAATGGLPWAIRRHPSLRADLALRVFRRRSHAALAVALAGAALAPRRPALAALALPWALATVRGLPPAAMPARLVRRGLREAAEMVVLAAGSARHRALVL
jgi:hypothetical protein